MKARSTHSYSKKVGKHEGYRSLNGRMGSKASKQSMPHIPSSKGRAGKARATVKNYA